METYFMRGDRPRGTAWRLVVLTGFTKYPGLSCIDKCNEMAMPWVAFKMTPEP